jgi:uncharacterized protein
MGLEATTSLLLLAFLGAAVMGAVAHKTNFCTMGSVSDWVNMGNTARLGAWCFSIAVAILGVLLLEQFFSVPLESTIPPYHTANFAWLRYLLGGLMFGVGMTLAGGCGSKTLINIGGGSLRSLFVFFTAAFMAYLMTKTSFYEVVFHNWINPTAIDLGQWGIGSQSLVDIMAALLGISVSSGLHWLVGLILFGLFLFIALRSKHFRKNKQLIWGGGIIGLVIVFGWYISGGPSGLEVIETVEWLDERPLGVGVQSYTFINPLGETLSYLKDPANLLLITYGVVAVFGVIVGSFVYAIISGTFRITKFSSKQDVLKHFIGGLLMGTGGVLAMGCTIGQGITGISTLAAGSLIVFVSIIFASALTIKISYYKMAYDDEATFFSSFLSTLVDFKMLPEAMRKLEEP